MWFFNIHIIQLYLSCVWESLKMYEKGQKLRVKQLKMCSPVFNLSFLFVYLLMICY